MNERLAILLLEDNSSDAELIEAILCREGLDPVFRRVDSERDFVRALREWTPDLIISDYSLPSYNGLAALACARSVRPDTPFIFFSGTIGEESAIEALKLGAVDYVLKQNPKRLIAAIRRALDDLGGKKRQREADEKILAQAQLIDLATDAIIVRGIDDRILFWNRGAERLYGYTAAEAEGALAKDLIFRSPAAESIKASQQTLRDGRWEGELEQVTRDGRAVVVTSRWTLVLDRAGHPERILTINTDITDRKQLEQQFLRAQRLESIGTLASGIAHDLNNILAPIFMGSELLEAENLPPDAATMVAMIKQSAQRGADIVKQVLTFVRGSDGKRVPLQLQYLLKEIAKVASDTFPKNIETACRIEPNLSAVRGDPTQLHQVLMNLCINARDAMPQGGKLTLAAKTVPAAGSLMVLIEVQDTGTGIPAQIVDKIFDPFFTTKEPGKGTGLGLSTALGIVKSHGGTLKVQSQEGAGTTFQVFLPVAASEGDGGTNALGPPLPRGHGELILIVDDEPEIRELMARICAENGYEVMTAEDGASGIVQFAGNKARIELVITDTMMPAMDGSSLAKVVRAMKPDTRIIATSGLSEHAALPEASRLLRKPFSTEELLRAVDEVLRLSPAG